VDVGYAAEYEELHRRHWWWRARESFLADELDRRAPPGGYGPILDVGCGNGLLFPVLARHGVPEGVEPDRSIVTAEGVARGAIHVRAFDETFRPGTRYGLVLMLDVLEHLARPVDALAHARSLLREGGAMAVTVPAGTGLWTSHDDLNHHLRRYTRRLLVDTAGAAGFHVESCEHWFGWLVPVKLAVRLKERWLGPGQQLHRVPPRSLNGACLLLSRLEHAMWGGALPLGTSLFAWLRLRSAP
jgi:SAM-dependent methyltransferase